MEWLRGWAMAAGCAAIAGSLALTLSPASGIQKVFKLVLSAFFLCCLVVPFITSKPDFNIQINNISNVKSEEIAEKLNIAVDERINKEASDKIKQEILRNLEDLGIIPLSAKIYIVTDRYNQKNTSVCAELVLDNKYSDRHDELVNYLKNKLGISVKLGYE